MKSFGKYFIIFLFLIILAWGIGLQYIPGHTSVWNYSYNLGYALLYIFGGIIGISAAFYVTTGISMGKALLYLGLGQIAYACGLIVWAYYNLFAHVAVPYPSAADFFFVLFYPLLAIGCWHFLTMVATHIHTQYLFEVMGIFFLAAVVILGFLNTPDTSAGVSGLTRIVNIWYPLGDSLLIALAYLVYRAGRGALQSGVLLLIVGLIIQAFADTIFSYQTNVNAYWNGSISDILFAVSGFALSLSILTIFTDFLSAPKSQ